VSSNYGYAEVWQSGALMASVTSNGNVEICSGDSLIILYHVGSYTWSSSTITITDADNSQLAYFDGTNHSTGDTIVAVANGCPNCLAYG
jgi:hypothetical protein